MSQYWNSWILNIVNIETNEYWILPILKLLNIEYCQFWNSWILNSVNFETLENWILAILKLTVYLHLGRWEKREASSSSSSTQMWERKGHLLCIVQSPMSVNKLYVNVKSCNHHHHHRSLTAMIPISTHNQYHWLSFTGNPASSSSHHRLSHMLVKALCLSLPSGKLDFISCPRFFSSFSRPPTRLFLSCFSWLWLIYHSSALD